MRVPWPSSAPRSTACYASSSCPTIRRELDAVARRARKGEWSYEEFLRDLLDEEQSAREQKAARHRLREARFPDLKTLDQIDWKALDGISRSKILELSTGEFLPGIWSVLREAENMPGRTEIAPIDATVRPTITHGDGSVSGRVRLASESDSAEKSGGCWSPASYRCPVLPQECPLTPLCGIMVICVRHGHEGYKHIPIKHLRGVSWDIFATKFGLGGLNHPIPEGFISKARGQRFSAPPRDRFPAGTHPAGTLSAYERVSDLAGM